MTREVAEQPSGVERWSQCARLVRRLNKATINNLTAISVELKRSVCSMAKERQDVASSSTVSKTHCVVMYDCIPSIIFNCLTFLFPYHSSSS
jgi:hypothetical protein